MQSWMTQDPACRLHERTLPGIARIVIELAIAVNITQRNHRHARAGSNSGLEQRSVVRLELCAVRSRPFRKDRYVLSARQSLHDGAVGTRRIVSLLTLDEDGACAFHQKADDRPPPDLRLGDEAYAHHRVDHPDIQP